MFGLVWFSAKQYFLGYIIPNTVVLINDRNVSMRLVAGELKGKTRFGFHKSMKR